MLPQWKIDIINYYIKFKKTKEIVFIHTPKCGGTYANKILKKLNIEIRGHIQAKIYERKITFTIIRNPIERYESLLNYRLNEKTPRFDFPKHLYYVYNTKKTLNHILDHMSNREIIRFIPYRTLYYWTQHINIVLTIDEFLHFLEYMGYKTTKDNSRENVSRKIRGTLNNYNKNRLKILYNIDLKIWKYWSRTM